MVTFAWLGGKSARNKNDRIAVAYFITPFLPDMARQCGSDDDFSCLNMFI
ncbi:hypothetical protein [Faecalispora sporosphaeroides]|nr:hypothetical protein [Faecalispora sporosphaeroides]